MNEGGIILSCGCRYQSIMGELDTLYRTWAEEICTRDPDNPFVMAEITGSYCAKCWARMQEISDDA